MEAEQMVKTNLKHQKMEKDEKLKKIKKKAQQMDERSVNGQKNDFSEQEQLYFESEQ